MSPRRRHQGEIVDDEAESQEDEEGREESITQRLKHRRVKLTRKRTLENIEDIDRELAGGEHTSSNNALTGKGKSSLHAKPVQSSTPHHTSLATTVKTRRDYDSWTEV